MMPDLSSAFMQWLLTQAEGISPEFFREGAWSVTMDRIVSTAMGTRESANLRALLDSPAETDQRNATILVPGILGSLLASTRGVSAILWVNSTLLLSGYLNLLDLAEDGESDASPDVDIVPFGIEKMTYLPLIQTLTRNSRLYEFPYDWRKSNVAAAHHLHESIQRWTTGNPSRRFTIVCHSMGSIVARTYMALYPKETEQLVERVIMVGAPLHGAAAAALAFSDRLHPYLLVAHMSDQNNLVQFSQSTPSTYELLPPPETLFTAGVPYPYDWDIYDAAAWPLPGVRQVLLDRARDLWEKLAFSDPQVDMVNFAGCHKSTVVSVLRASDDSPGVEPVYVEAGANSGDEQVPLWSARAANVTTHYVEDSHNALVSNDRVLTDLVALLHGGAPTLPTEVPPLQAQAGRRRLLPLAQQLTDIRERIENGTLTRVDVSRLFFWR
jgi:pimeloyl-ACP methyl ester carboxylesterase